MSCAPHETCPKPGEVWRFPVNAYAGSQETKDMRRVEVPFRRARTSASSRSGPSSAFPVIYVSDPRPPTVFYWADEDEHAQGNYAEEYA